MTTTTFDSREDIPRESTQLVTTTETTKPRASIPDTLEEERRNGQLPSTSTISMA